MVFWFSRSMRTVSGTWQLGVSDIDVAIAICQQMDLRFEVVLEEPRPDWSYKVVTVRSPNGFDVLLEEQSR
jgi:hypothetical protein